MGETKEKGQRVRDARERVKVVGETTEETGTLVRDAEKTDTSERHRRARH